MHAPFDRAAEDLGNIVHFEHLNLLVPDQLLATQFYIGALGLTRDPYLMTGVDNMWVNAGATQFHLPQGAAQRLRGRVVLVVPDRAALLVRLHAAAPGLQGTAFRVVEHARHVEVHCPWGNTLLCFEPDAARFGGIQLGIAGLEIDVPAGCAAGIVRFYAEVFGARAELADDSGGAPCAGIGVGASQWLVFRESDAPLAAYDGHHIQVYVADFSGPHRRLQERGLVTEESNQHQYRFDDIVDPQTGRSCFRLEHEVRSMTHPMCGRPLVNRNPQITARDYRRGSDTFRA